MLNAQKVRLYPTSKQKELISQQIGCVSCGFKANADVNAANNILDRHIVNIVKAG